MAKKDKATPPSRSDERNIVGSGQTDMQDIEDQLYLLWEKNKGLIVGGIAFIFLAFIGFQVFQYFQAQAEEELQEGYLAADTPEAKAEWAEEESGHPLSGFAYKELGDQAYQEGDLATAEQRYRNAVRNTKSVVKQAASIALAVTLSEQGKTDEAKQVLQTLANDDEAAAQPEAQYRLAQLEAAEGDAQAARSYIQAIDPTHAFWKAQATQLLEDLEEPAPEA